MRLSVHVELSNQAAVLAISSPLLSRTLVARTNWTSERAGSYRWSIGGLRPGSTAQVDVAGRTLLAEANASGEAVVQWDGFDAEGNTPMYALATLGGTSRSAVLGRFDARQVGLGGLMIAGYDVLDFRKRRILTGSGLAKAGLRVRRHGAGFEVGKGAEALARFDSEGFLTTVTARDGRTPTLEYVSSHGKLDRIVGGARDIEVERGGVGTTIREAGCELHMATDDDGRVVELTDPSGRPIQFSYHPSGLLASVTDGAGFSHAFEYDERGRIEALTWPGQGRVGIFSTDVKHGHKVTALSMQTRESYEQVQRLPDGTKVRTSNCCGDNPEITRISGATIEVVRSNGTQVKHSRERAERIVTLPSGLSNTRRRDAGSVEVNGRRFAQERSAAGITSTSPEGRKVELTESSRGTRIDGPQGHVEMLKDAKGNVIRVEGIDGGYDVQYGPHGQLSQLSWDSGETATYQYDASGYLESVSLPGARIVSLTRDATGFVRTLRTPGGEETTFELAGPGRLAQVTFPGEVGETNHVEYGYDTDGLLVSRRAGVAEPVRFERGPLGLVESIVAGDATWAFEYEGSRPVKGTTPSGQRTALSFDGALVTGIDQQGASSGAVSFAYNSDFQRSQITSGSLSAAIDYDADGLVRAVGAATLHRDTAGRITSVEAGVARQAFTYDALGRVEVSAVIAGDDELWSLRYEYDRSGRITAVTDSRPEHSARYSYDVAGRLTEATGPSPVTVQYDVDGNPTKIVREGRDEGISHHAGGRLVGVGQTRIEYGPGGAVESIGSSAVEWDGLGQAIACAGSTFTRDAFSAVVAMSDGQSTSNVLPDIDGTPIASTAPQGGETTALYASAARNSPPVLVVETERTLLVAVDHVGSVRMVIDISTGEVVERRDYDAWGTLTNAEGHRALPCGFAGGVDDPASGLVVFPARVYSPLLMRWLSRDPDLFLGGSTHLYEYAGSDPVNRIDRTGRKSAGTGGSARGGVEVCRNATDIIPGLGAEHHWIRTTELEAGMAADPVVTGGTLENVVVGDHTGAGDQPGSSCDPVDNVDEECVNQNLQMNKSTSTGYKYGMFLGVYGIGKNGTCQTFVEKVLSACSNGEYSIETSDPDAYDHFYGPDYQVSPMTPAPTPAPDGSGEAEADHTPDPGYTPAEESASGASDSSTDDGELWE